jgi:hypothetical protein
MFYYFKDKHKLLEGKLEFKEYNYKFNSYEMELYSEGAFFTVKSSLSPSQRFYLQKKKLNPVATISVIG